jgi:tRNA modification GTPase
VGPGAALIAALNKVDLLGDTGPVGAEGTFRISVLTGAGMTALTDAIARHAEAGTGASETPVITQARHRRLVEVCTAALEAYLAGEAAELELRAEDLRRAATALGRITGRVDVEDVLGAIFGRFCIGK